MISTKNIVDKANSKIAAGNLTSLEISQLSGVNTFLSGSAVPSVATFTDLPDVQLNKGRLLYVIDEEIHYFSDGDIWTSDFSSQSTNILYAWGLGTSGQLGDNTTINKASPVTVVGGITNWSKISAGSSANHSLALIDTGVLYTWGGNNVGELGDGTTIARSSPITVVGGITNWSQISAGTNFSLALTDNGVLYAWGSNLYGSIGDGTTTYRSSPVTVVGGITSWSQITSALTTLALTDTGILYAWGFNLAGQLGDGTTTSRSSPVTVVGGITNWSQVSAKGYHSSALTDTGILYVWGPNFYGQLGDNTTINRSSPVTVVGGITNWSQISAGYHSMALTDTGVLYAWGLNFRGQIGDGTRIDRSSPVTVIGGITSWSQISADFHSVALTDTGVLYAWGLNDVGRLGDGTGTARSSPVTVVGGITSWSQIDVGGAHNLALSSKGF